jgi:hypothetical protein
MVVVYLPAADINDVIESPHVGLFRIIHVRDIREPLRARGIHFGASILDDHVTSE